MFVTVVLLQDNVAQIIINYLILDIIKRVLSRFFNLVNPANNLTDENKIDYNKVHFCFNNVEFLFKS